MATLPRIASIKSVHSTNRNLCCVTGYDTAHGFDAATNSNLCCVTGYDTAYGFDASTHK